MRAVLKMKDAPAAATAFWSAPVLWRFGMPRAPRKAPEDWRSPKASQSTAMHTFATILLSAVSAISAFADATAEQDARFAALPPATSLVSERGIAAFTLSGKDGTAKLLADTQQIRTVTRPANPYNLQLGAKTTAPIKEGDHLIAIVWARGTELPAGSDEARTEFVVEMPREPYTKSVTYPIAVGAAWQKFYIPFTAKLDHAPGDANVLFRAGYEPQVIELAAFQLLNYGTAVAAKDLPFTANSYRGREPDAAWRAAAAERIERIRKGDLTIAVTRGGAPVAGAEVHVKMKRHAFGWGSAVDARQLLATGPDADRYRAVIVGNFNKVVIENHLKWPVWEKDRETGSAAVKWLREHGLDVRGHCFVWPGKKNLPSSVAALLAEPAKLDAAIVAHIADMGGALRGQCVEWDVVNEPFTNFDVQAALTGIPRDGAPDWIERHAATLAPWFRAAQTADPGARLYINDYSILSSGGRDTAHQDHYFATIRELLRLGAPVQGIGLQSHFDENLTPPARMIEILDRFATLGLPLQGTEHDVNVFDERLHADFTRDYLTVMFSHPSVTGVLTWGFWEKRHWIPNAAYYRSDWSLRPAGQVWQDLVRKQWWTDTTLRTGPGAEAGVRGFLGEYEIVVRSGDVEKTVTARLGADGTKVVVALN